MTRALPAVLLLAASAAPVGACGSSTGANVDLAGVPVDATRAAADLSLARDAVGDLASADLTHADLGLAQVDLSPARPDQAAPGIDLAPPEDLAVPVADLPALTDLAVADRAIPDLTAPSGDLTAVPDLLCGGNYLNSGAANACPLGCSANVTPVTDESRYHISFCTPFPYLANPPASGPHWPAPAAWGVHTDVVPREWWVHNLEHQGVVLLYNCPAPDAGAAPSGPTMCTDGGVAIEPPAPADCATEIAQLTALIASHPMDPWNEDRILLTADPRLPHRFAAVAWDWRWMSDTLDVAAIQCLIDARYGRGPEAAP